MKYVSTSKKDHQIRYMTCRGLISAFFTTAEVICMLDPSIKDSRRLTPSCLTWVHEEMQMG